MIIQAKWVTGTLETRSILNKHRPLNAPTVNWSAAGAQSIDEAIEFAHRILGMCSELSRRSDDSQTADSAEVVRIHIEMNGKYANAEIDKRLVSVIPEFGVSTFIAHELSPYIEAMLSLDKDNNDE